MRVPIIMAGAEESKGMKREHEPITMVCFVVLLLACAIVIGTWASDQISGDSSETVQYGDSITVEYTGSLYDYYDKATDDVKPVIFDTNVKSIGTNSDYLFTSTFNGTYSATTLTLGQYKFLAAFEDGLMGKKVGDTVRITIPAGEGYPDVVTNTSASSFTINNNFTMTKSELGQYFENVSGDITGLTSFTSKVCETLKADVMPSGSSYTVKYTLASGDTHVVLDNALGKVTLTVTGVSGTSVTFTLGIENTKPVKDAEGNPVQIDGKDAIEMLSLKLFKGATYNIVAGSGTDIVYNSVTNGTSLIGGYELYFVVKIVSKN